MPYALLLSPDDQAVSAITGVLEEMSVTCERPLDGVSAAQKLNSQNFDLVLVDCENLPAAKLIFDVCRRGKNGHTPIPIAIVDGRAGLPTAFRLGAELILTKPVSKDQARGTIRTAVSRVRKGAQEQVTAQAAAAFPEVEGSASAPQELAFAAAAAGSGSTSGFASTLPGSAATSQTHSSFEEIDAPASDSQPNPQSATSLEAPVAVRSSATWNGKFPVSDDPVLGELESTEKEESAQAQSKQAELTKVEPQKESLKPKKAEQPAAKSSVAASSSRRGQQKTKGLVLAFLMLALAASGFYAAWMYQPAFRVIVQPQVDRVLSLLGMALPPTPSSHPVKPSAQVAPATTGTAAVPTNSAPAANTTSVASEPSASDTAATPATGATPATVSSPQPPTTAIAPAGSSTSPTGDKAKPGESKATDATPSASQTNSVSPKSSSAVLPDESSAVLLSSKGAESRLIHSVPPIYPAEARSSSSAAQATVVLKEVVDETGKVEGVRLVDGNAALAPAAIRAVKQWRYRPFVRDGKAQPFQSVVTIDFQRP